MKTLKLYLDFLAGPVWKRYFNEEKGCGVTGIDVVDNDAKLWELNQMVQDMYTSCYQFDVGDQPFIFTTEGLDKKAMMDAMQRVKDRLAEINDGSFVIEDYATAEIMSL
ncbi:MAG: hypothetical protein IJ713_00345 [Oscillibacter sp.]|nr:hypothetical protein [Oscillibacter sp.]